jgi:oxygen-dependent protoporphyrinogen oxidase
MRVVTVGAGITGLALTHYLAERGVDSVALEASEEAGGVIQSRPVDGTVAEIGPQRMRATPGVRDLVDAAGLADDLVTAGDGALFVYADGRLREAPTSKEAFFRTDLLSWPAKLRLLAEPLTRPGIDQETVADTFTRKFGQQAYERFIGPLYGGLYGSDPAEMPAAFALSGLMDREEEAGSMLRAFLERVGQGEKAPPATVEGGLQRLPEALAGRYGDRVHLDEPVTEVRPAGDAKGRDPDATVAAATDGGAATREETADVTYTVETSEGTYEADHVVVTAPAGAAGELLEGVAPGADRLRELTYNPLALVYLRSDGQPADGLGYQVSYQEDLHTLGVSFNGVLFGRDDLCTVFLGGMHEPELLEESDDRLGDIARREFEEATGTGATVLDIERRERWFPAYDHTWWGTEEVETPAGVHLATNYTARMGIPSRVREAKQVAEELAGG